MTTEDKKKRIEILNKEIKERQDELDVLVKEISNSLDISFREKFSYWVNNAEHRQLTYLPNGSVGTYLRDTIVNKERGVINILELEEFGIYAYPEDDVRIFDSPEEADEYIKNLESNQGFMNSCAQMMKENFDSFAIDW